MSESPNPEVSERLDVPAGSPAPSIVLVLFGLGLMALCLSRQPQEVVIVLTAAPIVLAVIFFLIRQRPMSIQFSESGFQVLGESEVIPYSSIQAVTIRSRSLRATDKIPYGDVLVVHAGGTVKIARQARNIRELYVHFASQLAGSGSRQVNSKLAPYLQQQLEDFEDDLVWSFCARSNPSARLPHRRAWVTLFWLFITCIVLAVVTAADKQPGGQDSPLWGLALIGITTSVLILVGAVILKLIRIQPARNTRGASIVIGPVGIAMSQGPLFGVLSWEEIKGIHHGRTAKSFQPSSSHNATAGLRLDVAGASFYIADVYDRPLWLIHEVAQRLWQ